MSILEALFGNRANGGAEKADYSEPPRASPSSNYEEIFYNGDAVMIMPISNGYLLKLGPPSYLNAEPTRFRYIYAATEEEIVQQLIAHRANKALGNDKRMPPAQQEMFVYPRALGNAVSVTPLGSQHNTTNSHPQQIRE